MKKYFITISILLLIILTFSNIIFAEKIIKVDFTNSYNANGKEDENASGYALVNYNPPDKEDKGVGVTVIAKFEGLIPNTEYKLYNNGQTEICIFTAKNSGKGTAHLISTQDYRANLLILYNIDDSYMVLYAYQPFLNN